MKLFPNRTHYQIHTVHNVPHPDMFTEAWTTIVNVCYVIVFMKGMGKEYFFNKYFASFNIVRVCDDFGSERHFEPRQSSIICQ